MQSFDETTGETIGTYYYDLVVPHNEDKYCFSITGLQASSAQEIIFPPDNNNGKTCKLDVCKRYLCQGKINCDPHTEKPLYMHIDAHSDSGPEIRIKIVQAGTKPDNRNRAQTMPGAAKFHAGDKCVDEVKDICAPDPDHSGYPVCDDGDPKTHDRQANKKVKTPVRAGTAEPAVYDVYVENTRFQARIVVISVKISTLVPDWPRGITAPDRSSAKLLATASHLLKGEVRPLGVFRHGTLLWKHPLISEGQGRFSPPNEEKTTITAPNAITAELDKDLLSLQFTIGDLACSDEVPLNITAPRKFSSPQDGMDVLASRSRLPATGTYVSTKNESVPLFNVLIGYEIFDQFYAPISDSDYGDNNGMKPIKIREILPWAGERSAWAKANITSGNEADRATPWSNLPSGALEGIPPPKAHQFIDQISVASRPYPLGDLYDTSRRLLSVLRSNGKLIFGLNTHNWEVSIDGQVNTIQVVSNNLFTFTIEEYQNDGQVDRFKLGLSYKVDVK